MKKYCIYGMGGFGIETFFLIKDIHDFSLDQLRENIVFMVDDEYYIDQSFLNCEIIKLSTFISENYKVVVAVSNPQQRKNMVLKLPQDTIFSTLVHPSVIKSSYVEIGQGSIITAGCILTCQIKIGEHAHLNLMTTVGHDCVIGDYFTSSPSVNISGNCLIENEVFIGSGSSIREKIKICNNVVIGMGSIVLEDIIEKGTYFGAPARKSNH